MQLPSDANSTGRNFGQEELEILKRVIESGTLNCTKGTVVKEFERAFIQPLRPSILSLVMKLSLHLLLIWVRLRQLFIKQRSQSLPM